MLSIVVARYNEDLEWLNPVKEYVHLYNKGQPLSDEQKNSYAMYKELPNVGREAHTYLKYIIEHYDKLPSVVCFTQGNIDDHYKLNTIVSGTELLISLMNTAVTSTDGYSINFQDSCGQLYIGPYFNTNMEDARFVSFFKSEENYNNKMIPFKEWFENTLNISYPEKYRLSWNGIFAVRGELIRRRSLNFYKRLLKEVDRINAPVEAHFFERAWYYVFQEPESDLDAYYYCHKHPLATYKSLESFRKYHPWSKIYLISDNGYDYSEMAKHFNCNYKKMDTSVNTGFSWFKNLSHEEAFEKYKMFCNNLLSIAEDSSAKYLIKLEDDVCVQGKIMTSKLKGCINGPKINRIPDIIFKLYYTNRNEESPTNVYFSGHGGCIYNREQLIDILNAKEIENKISDIVKYTNFIGGYMIDDIAFSIIATILGYKIEDNPEQMEIETEKNNKSIEKSIILHQYKEHYNKMLPDDLAHLVKIT